MSILARLFAKLVAALAPEKPETSHVLENKDYLTNPDRTVTTDPLLQFKEGEFIRLFNLVPIAQYIDSDKAILTPDSNVTKRNGHAPLQLAVRASETGQVVIISLVGLNTQAYAVLKNPSDSSYYHLDLISVFEEGVFFDIPCGAGDGDLVCLEQIVECFHNAIGNIYDDPASANEDNELSFSQSLKPVLEDLADVQRQRAFAATGIGGHPQ